MILLCLLIAFLSARSGQTTDDLQCKLSVDSVLMYDAKIINPDFFKILDAALPMIKIMPYANVEAPYYYSVSFDEDSLTQKWSMNIHALNWHASILKSVLESSHDGYYTYLNYKGKQILINLNSKVALKYVTATKKKSYYKIYEVKLKNGKGVCFDDMVIQDVNVFLFPGATESFFIRKYTIIFDDSLL